MASKGFATRKRTAQDFINEAGVVSKDNSTPTSQEMELTSEEEGPFPWEHPELSSRVQKQYNLRLDEITLEKLRWVGQNVTVSTHQWVVNVLQAAIEEKISELRHGEE